MTTITLLVFLIYKKEHLKYSYNNIVPIVVKHCNFSRSNITAFFQLKLEFGTFVNLFIM